jgi:hypothetical protein
MPAKPSHFFFDQPPAPLGPLYACASDQPKMQYFLPQWEETL